MSSVTPNLGLVQPAMTDEVDSTIPALATNLGIIDTTMGKPGNLTTTDKSSLVNAVNENVGKITALQADNASRAINVKYPPAPLVAAKGDWNGTTGTDDTAAIQAAINYLTNGGTIIFPPAAYHTTTTLSIPSNIMLLGYNAKITCAIGTAITITGTNVVFDGPWIENTYSSGCIGINFGTGSGNVIIKNCKFTGQNAQAVNINSSGVFGVLVTNCLFDGVTYGVLANVSYSGSTPQGAYDLKDLRVIGNRFTNVYGDAIELNNPIGTVGVAYTAMRDITIEGNYIDVVNGTGSGAGFGVGVAGATNVSIMGNTIKNCRWQGIHLEDKCRNVVVSGNIIDATGNVPASNNNSGIYVLDGSYISIIGNSVYSATYAGIHCEYDSSHQATNTAIQGNIVNNCGNSGIIFNGNGGQDSIIEGNSLTNNGADGITLNGSGTNIKISNNICKGNTGYGLNPLSSKRGLNIQGNSFFGNTAGDINVTNISTPLVIKTGINVYDATVTTNNTPWTNCFSLGVGASGSVTITAADDLGNRSTCLYTISWNGTTLTTTLVNKSNSGNIDATGGLQMSGNILQFRTYSGSANGTNIHHEVQFEGMIMLK